MSSYSLIFLICTIMLLFLIMSNKFMMDKEKLYSFECGFDPFTWPRTPFSIHFFKIILIFLLFDIEIILVLPLPLFQAMNWYMIMSSCIILLTLLLGLYFEWIEGSLNWIY